MKILFADSTPSSAVDRLNDLGHHCVVKPDLKAADVPYHIDGFDVLVVRSTRVTADAIRAGKNLALVVRAGAGTNTIDARAASDFGVYVCNVPGRNAIAVAELAMGLLIAIDRHLADAVADLREGQWNKKTYKEADGLYGKTIGLVGLGEIALMLAERAKAFGMTPVAVRKHRSPLVENRLRSIGIHLVDDLDSLFAECDVVSIHLPGDPANVGFVDARRLSLMRPGAVLLNTSRGDVVDETALLDALDTRGLRAGLDVFDGEPAEGAAEFESRLASHPRVVGSHHIGASTRQAQESVAAGVVEVIEAFAAGGVRNCVNLATEVSSTARLMIRHFDRVGVLASVLDVLRKEHLNVDTMQNQIFAGANAAVATINVTGVLNDVVIAELEALDNVISVAVISVAVAEVVA